MSKSSKLASAVQILSFVASHAPNHVTTDTIAAAIEDHPTRVRQIVAALARAGLLDSLRGANGGVALSRPAAVINLGEVFQAVGEAGIIGLEVRAIASGWQSARRINAFFDQLYQRMDREHFDLLRRTSLQQILESAAAVDKATK